MQTDPDRQLGEIFQRLCHLRMELGELAYSRAIHTLLVALGRAALEEAESCARTMDARHRPQPTDIKVTAFADRRPADTWDETIPA